MKKFYAIALGALVLAAGCSKDDPEPTLPNLEVNEVTLTPSYSQIQAPAQVGVEYDVYDLIVSYENGQQIEYSHHSSTTTQNVLLVKKIKGENVIVPPTVTDQGTTYIVGGWNLSSYEGVGKETRTITIANSSANSMQGNSTEGVTLRPTNNQFFTDLSDASENLEAVYLEEGFGNYYSDKGVIYHTNNSKTRTTLVMVPRKYMTADAAFTLPNGVNIIGEKAFAKCEQFSRIIISADVAEIANYAFDNTKNVIAVDMLPTKAPIAQEHAFGHYLRQATLRIPNGSYESYMSANPFAELEPNTTHPVPDAAYVTYMGLDRNYFSAANTKDWTEEDWEENVVPPTEPTESDTAIRWTQYNSVRAIYAKYQAALRIYIEDRTKWYTAQELWNEADATKILDDAKPYYEDKNLAAPKRPTNVGQNATPEEIEEYNKAMEEYVTENIAYNENQGAINQMNTDMTYWKSAKTLWESTRGYQFFKNVQQVDFIL